jgi:hypothetical protein
MRTDPADTGGLFVGRRPGTAPIRFRALPQLGTTRRQRIDGYLAALLLCTIIALCLLCWGPVPLACLWIGSEVDYVSGSLFLGIVSAFIALFPLLFGALSILSRLDQVWILVRRAAGHDQRVGALARIFAMTAIVCAVTFTFWLLVIHGPGSLFTSPGAPTLTGIR